MRPIVIFVALLLSALPAVAADRWTAVKSKNFLLVGSASEDQIRDVAEDLELFRSAFARFFKLKEVSTVGTTVVVFKSDAAFKPYKPVYKGKPANVAGYFQSGQDVNFIALTPDEKQPRVIYHEFVHKLMADNMKGLPPWFQEGFAECFSTLEIEGKDRKIRLGLPIAEHVQLLNEKNFMPLEKLFAVVHNSAEYNEDEKQGLFYAESWAFVHYMMLNTDDRRNRFFQFLDGIAAGVKPSEAFEDAFDTELSKFQREFEAYIQQRMAWNAMQIDRPKALDRQKDFPARPLSEAESEFYLGDLMLHTNRLPEAETHLAKAIQLDEKLGSAHASMGLLRMRQSRHGDALPFMQRATELETGNYLTHYYYATLLRGRSITPTDTEFETMRSELKKAIELAPHFVEATDMLASANLMKNVEIPDTVERLVKALSFAPGRDSLVLQLAFAISRTQQRERARPILQDLLARQTLAPPLRQSAENLVQYLDRVTAADAQVRALPNREVVSRLSEVEPAPVDQSTPAATGPFLGDKPPEQLAPGTARLRGVLTLLDCKDGVTLSLLVEGKTLKLHSATPSAIKFTTFNAAVSSQIACGPTPGKGVPASILYRIVQSGESLGEPLAVDFVED